MLLLAAPWMAFGQNSQTIVKRDASALKLMALVISTLDSQNASPDFTKLRVAGTLTRSAVSGPSSGTFTFDTAWIGKDFYFNLKSEVGSVSNSQIGSSRSPISHAKDPLAVPRQRLYRAAQPAYVPYAIFARALSDASLSVIYEGHIRADGLDYIRIATAPDASPEGQSTYLRHWLINPSTLLPYRSTICIATTSAVPCRVRLTSQYSAYKILGGVMTPSDVVVSTREGPLVGRDQLMTVQSVASYPSLTATDFTPESPQ